MSKKALLVGLEYPSEPDLNSLYDSVTDVLEFNRCLIERLNFLQSDIDILVDTSATIRGDKQFNANEVTYKLLQLVSDAKEGDLLLFAFSGHGTYGGPNGPELYLGCDQEGQQVFMNALVFEGVLNQLNHKSKPNKLYMFINGRGSDGLLKDFGFNNQLTNHNDVNPPIPRYPSVIAYLSSIRDKDSKSTFNYRWDCHCSSFIYAVIRAIEGDKNATNLELGQCIDLILEEVGIVQAEISVMKARHLDGEKKKEALKKALKLVQRATLLCTDAQSRAQFLSD